MAHVCANEGFFFLATSGKVERAGKYCCGKLIETFSLCMIIITINLDKTLCADSVASTVPNIDRDTVFIKKTVIHKAAEDSTSK